MQDGAWPFTRTNREQRKDQIVALLTAIMPGWASHEEIAEWMHLAKTPYTRQMLIDLIHEKRVRYQWWRSPSGQRLLVFAAAGGEDDTG